MVVVWSSFSCSLKLLRWSLLCVLFAPGGDNFIAHIRKHHPLKVVPCNCIYVSVCMLVYMQVSRA